MTASTADVTEQTLDVAVSTVSAAEIRAMLRRQQKIEELCAASIRALSGQRDLQFRGNRLHRGSKRLPYHAPHLRASFESDDFDSFRGVADGLALRLRYSNDALHRQLSPLLPIARLIFESLEQYRVESLAQLPGVVSNVRHRHERWSADYYASGLLETAQGMLLFTILQMCRSRVTAQPVVAQTEDRIESTRAGLAPQLGSDLHGLRQQRYDQTAYGQHAVAIADLCMTMLAAAGARDELTKQNANRDTDEQTAKKQQDARNLFKLLLQVDDENTSAPSQLLGRSRVLDEAHGAYAIFTRAYDVTVKAASLVRAEQLQALRDRLDQLVAAQEVNVTRVARELRRLLAQPIADGRVSAQEEGQIDGRRLAQLIACPTQRHIFTQERIEPIADCAMTLLIDCSGSMKQHADAVAIIVDILARALELAGVSSEILGYTTNRWHGGRALRDWQSAGRPAAPGRLNELCHLVFKDADTSWRRARRDIAALLKLDLYRESIDGEALDWACDRLLARAESRRIVLVISDGCPMDSATAMANDDPYLDQHLRDVVERRSRDRSVAILGVGVGLDLSPYYRKSQIIELSDRLRNGVFDEILNLMSQ